LNITIDAPILEVEGHPRRHPGRDRRHRRRSTSSGSTTTASGLALVNRLQASGYREHPVAITARTQGSLGETGVV